MIVNVDNHGSIDLAENSVFRDRSRHIDTHHHFTCGRVKERRFHVEYIPTKDMLEDLLTKSLPRP